MPTTAFTGWSVPSRPYGTFIAKAAFREIPVAGIRGALSTATTRTIAVDPVATLTAGFTHSDNFVRVRDRDWLIPVFAYTKGDETTVEILMQHSPDNGVSWLDYMTDPTPVAGVVVPLAIVWQYSATSTVAPEPISVTAMDLIRFASKATGGTPTGTLGISVMGG